MKTKHSHALTNHARHWGYRKDPRTLAVDALVSPAFRNAIAANWDLIGDGKKGIVSFYTGLK